MRTSQLKKEEVTSGNGNKPWYEYVLDQLKQCETNCWLTYPPFSGQGDQRGACIKQCQKTYEPPDQNGGNGNMLGTLAVVGGILALPFIVKDDKPKRRR